MKLAEALLERANLKQKLMMLSERLNSNARVQEGLEPNETPKNLLEELDDSTQRLEFLIVHINKTNELTKTTEGTTISQLIAKRDVLSQKLKILRSFVNEGSFLVSRMTHSEIKTLPTFSVVKMQKEIDSISEEIRVTDTKIQEMNWTTDLL